MKFPIEIRNVKTGAAHALQDLQHVANFLAGKAHDEWEGFRHLGALPEPTVTAPEALPVAGDAAALVDQSAASVSVPPAETDAPYLGTEPPPSEPHPQSVDAAQD